MKASGGVLLVGAAVVLSALGLVAVFSSRRPPAGDDGGDAPEPEPEPTPAPLPVPPDTSDERRQRILDAASAELGHVGGDRYFATEHPAYIGTKTDWCGVFALWALHQAGLALDRQWIDGKGFILTGVHPLPATKNPQPGDLIYIDQPFQHQGIVERVDGDRVHTIDGNTRNTVAEHDRARSDITAFFSIEPLLAEAGIA
jgi:hypothetical protein